MGRGQPSNINRSLEVDSRPLPDGFEGFKMSVEEVAVVETARELDGEPGDAIELRPSRGKARTDEESLLTDARRRCFFFFFSEMDSTRGDDAAEIVQMATNGLEYYTSLSDKAAAGFERTDSSF